MTEKIDSVIELILFRSQADVKLSQAANQQCARPKKRTTYRIEHGLSPFPRPACLPKKPSDCQAATPTAAWLPGTLSPIKDGAKKGPPKNRKKDPGRQHKNGKPRNIFPGFFDGCGFPPTNPSLKIPHRQNRSDPTSLSAKDATAAPIRRMEACPVGGVSACRACAGKWGSRRS